MEKDDKCTCISLWSKIVFCVVDVAALMIVVVVIAIAGVVVVI